MGRALSLSPSSPGVLIAAVSGRALAEAAARAGYRPLVADLFGDVDTRAIAARHRLVPGGLGAGLRRQTLLPALDALAAGEAPIGLVCGAGFEDRPALLAMVARRHRLIGSGADIVGRAKAPEGFAAICAASGALHPAVAAVAPSAEGWLDKRVGGSGGGHIRPANPRRRASRRRYAQARAAGLAVSALVLGDGRRARALCLTEQWADPARGAMFRYGGALRPALLASPLAEAVSAACVSVAAGCGLVGLGSVDCLVSGDGVVCLELNPRPGATIDLCDDAAGTLFALHKAACDGRLDDRLPDWPGAAGAAYVYADRQRLVPDDIAWPDWASDRPDPLSIIPAGAPLCTIRAQASEPARVRALLGERRLGVFALLKGSS